MAIKVKNPFTWVEIYVDDMNRARKFYEAVLDLKLTEMPMPGESSAFANHRFLPA